MEIGLLIALRGVQSGDETSTAILSGIPELKVVRYAFSKIGVLQACKEDSNINVVIVGEYLQKESPYTVQELSEISEIRDGIRVVPVIVNEHHGSEYVVNLFHEAIYGAVLEKDAAISYICSVICSGRTKKEARLYYGINSDTVNGSAKESSDSISSCVAHILRGESDAQAIEARAIYVKDRLSFAEMQTVLNKLPENIVDVLKSSESFREFFGEPETKVAEPVEEKTVVKEVYKEVIKEVPKEVIKKVPVIKRQEVKIPFPSFVSSAGTKTVYIEQERTSIGVIGLSEKCGSTFVALNLSKAMTTDERYTPTFLQFPDADSSVYNDYDFDSVFGDDYIDHFDYIDKKLPIPEQKNEFEDVCFMVNRGLRKKWTFVKALLSLNNAGSHCVVDLGNRLDNEQMSVLGQCQIVVAVVDARCEPDVSMVREFKKSIADAGKLLIFVVNHAGGLYEDACHQLIGNDFYIVDVPEYSEWSVKLNGKGMFVKDVARFTEILSVCGLLGKEGGVLFKKQKAPQVGTVSRTYLNGTMEVGFIGAGRGTGVTHSALMCANALANDYKVAYVELNSYRHIGKFAYVKNLVDSMSAEFTYQGVDFYPDAVYADFLTRYRQKYNFIIYDFGAIEDFTTPEIFFGLEKKFVVLPNALWRRKDVGDFVDMVSQKYDPSRTSLIVFPFVDLQKDVNELADTCEGFEVAGLGVELDAFHPTNATTNLFRGYILPNQAVGEGRKKHKGKGWAFWRRK